jgi:hypothetical protein
MMDKSKHKRGEQSPIEQLFVKRLSFCSPLPLDVCAAYLRSNSESISLSSLFGFDNSVSISVKPLDSDHYKFKMRKIHRMWPYAYAQGTLARMGDETLVNARVSIGWFNGLSLLISTLWAGYIFGVQFSDSPFFILLVFAAVSFNFLYFTYHRNQLTSHLVEMLERQRKTW